VQEKFAGKVFEDVGFILVVLMLLTGAISGYTWE
jgi:hypothetical protein